jgi:hypothetical protein
MSRGKFKLGHPWGWTLRGGLGGKYRVVEQEQCGGGLVPVPHVMGRVNLGGLNWGWRMGAGASEFPLILPLDHVPYVTGTVWDGGLWD